MRYRLLIATCVPVFVITLAIAIVSQAGSLDPPTGPVAPTSPSLAEVLAGVQSIGDSTPFSPSLGDLMDLATNQRGLTRISTVVGDSTARAGWIDTFGFLLGVGADPANGQALASNVRVLLDRDSSFVPVLEQLGLGGSFDSLTFEIEELGVMTETIIEVELTSARPVSATPSGSLYLAEFSFTTLRLEHTVLDGNGNPMAPRVWIFPPN